MYKITLGQKTMVGCNEDAWRTSSRIWFENGGINEYGACFSGSRIIAGDDFAPQSGMNEHGLIFSRLASYHPILTNWSNKSKPSVPHADYFLKEILHSCRTVEEVHSMINAYNYSVYLEDVLIFIDASGKYLVVEPYRMIYGNDPNYVLSNFCPSITTESRRRALDRYKDGVDFLKKGADTSLAYCSLLSKEMHVSRSKIGDGTLLTSIWDSKTKAVSFYFYHDYSHAVHFNLADELSKGDHFFDSENLFPKNSAFEQLKNYVTPFNAPFLRVVLFFLGIYFFSVSIYFLIQSLKSRFSKQLRLYIGSFSIFCALLCLYMYVLVTNIDLYYFPAPFVHFKSALISVSSYIPYALAIVILPSLYFYFPLLKSKEITFWSKLLLSSTHFIFCILLVSFCYWELF